MMRAATKRGDEGGGQATAKRGKKRVSAARARVTAMATVTWVAGDEEGEGDGGKVDGNERDGNGDNVGDGDDDECGE
jgi:hypothetical protein